MSEWDKLVEAKIREAMAEGAFDNLPGKGQPIDLSENPFEPPDVRMAHRLLKSNNFAPAWIEERKELDQSIEGALAGLARSWQAHRQTLRARRPAEQAEADWRQTLNAFRRRVADLNRRIAAYNLKAPSVTFHRLPVDAEREISKLVNHD